MHFMAKRPPTGNVKETVNTKEYCIRETAIAQTKKVKGESLPSGSTGRRLTPVSIA